jgi:GT2 family glycosyltransferase
MNQPDQPQVSVILPTYRRCEPLLRSLEDLLAQDGVRFEIIVADQNPQWPAELVAERDRRQADPRVIWLKIPSPGVVAARHAAVAIARGDILLFVDDDVFVPSRQLMANHVKRLADASIAAVAGRERFTTDDVPPDEPVDAVLAPPAPAPAQWSPLEQALRFNRNGEQPQRVCTFSTCNGAIRKSAFLAVGGFDESFTGNSYGDDYDLALRLEKAGYSIVYEPRAWLIHRRVPAGGLRLTDRANPVRWTATARTAWLFVLRHGHRGLYRELIYSHVLRKTILFRPNLERPWRQPRAVAALVLGLWGAWRMAPLGPVSRFTSRSSV